MLGSGSQGTRANLRFKLSLKRSNSDSIQNTLGSSTDSCSKSSSQNDGVCTEQNVKNDSLEDFQSPKKEKACNDKNVDDSLADFKSPKEEKKPHPILKKFKFDREKVKKKLKKSKSKPTRSAVDTNQPSIESSFFKPQASNLADKESFPCPLCLKPFKDDTTCHNHMKTCAAKKKISTEQLLDAKRLQDRQAEERKALGLLAAPVIPEKKKTFRSKNYSTEDDPQLQLVLAMSESLYQAEQQQEFEQAAVLAGVPSECLQDINAEERKTLQGFGFSTNKPLLVDAPVRQSKKRKLRGPTILLSRSKEDKDRVLTERIACIITGDDALTQSRNEDTSTDPQKRTATLLASQKLRSIERSSDRLWDRSRLTKTCSDFFVERLKSQLLALDTDESCADLKAPSEKTSFDANLSIEYEPDVDVEILIQNKYEQDTLLDEMDLELYYMKKSIANWSQALNSSAQSDVIIFVKNNKEIYAHKLVLYVQWSNILHSMEVNDSLRSSKIKNKICWLTKDQLSALAFLEFIYCGCISKNVEVFDKKNLLAEVEQLATQYKVTQLLDYIKLKQNEQKTSKSNESRNTSRHRGGQNASTKSIIHSPLQQFKTPAPSNKISYENYKETQGIPALPANVQQTTSYIKKRSRQTQTHDVQDSTANSISKTMQNQGTQTTESLEKSNTDTEINGLTEWNPEPVVDYPMEPTESNVESVMNSSARPIQPILQNIRGRLTNSPELFESLNESLFERHTQSEPSQNSTALNVLVDLANDDVNDDQVDVVPITEEQQVQDNPNECEIVNSQKTVHNLSPTPRENSSKNTNCAEVIALESDDSNNEESIYDAVTPPRRNSSERDFRSIIEKDSFLKKIDRINAKDDLASDSESDLSILQQKVKNPFLKRHRDDSYRYLQSDGKNGPNKRVISILEQDVLDDEKLQNASGRESLGENQTLDHQTEKKINENFKASKDLKKPDDLQIVDDLEPKKLTKDIPSSNTKSSSDNISDCSNATIDDNELSLYSRYKKQNQHNNSIQKYRSELNLESKRNNSRRKNHNTNNEKTDDSSKSNLKSVSSEKNETLSENKKVEDVTLVDDSDEEEQNPSKTSTSTKSDSHLQKNDNSIPAPNISRSEYASLSSIDLVDQEISKIMNAAEEPKDQFVDLCYDSDENEKGCTSVNKNGKQGNDLSKQQKEASNNEIIANKDDNAKKNHNLDSSEIAILSSDDEDAEKPHDSKSENSSKNKINESNKNNNSNKNSDVDLGSLENDWFNDDWTSKSPPEITRAKTRSSTSNLNKINSSANELACRNDFSKFDSPQSPLALPLQEHQSYKKQFSEFDSLQSPPLSPPKNVGLPENELIEIDSSPSSPASYEGRPTDEFSKFDSPQSPPASPSQNVRILPTSTSPILSQNRSRSQATRKLQTKSASTSNFETPPKKKTEKKSREYEDAMNNLSLCETPELHKKLKEFGLKPQNRKNSKLLLRHVYSELAKNPENRKSKKRLINEDSASETEEPPLKKPNSRVKSKKDSSKENVASKQKKSKSSENREVIAEEINYDEPETATGFTLKDSKSIKEAFDKLIMSDRGLHNKVLTYEPLPLENLHSSLKEKGFKCDKNSLMDFLDEQCITFQVKAGKKDDRRKKKK
ncbi:uncharacterized protein LOC106646921 isoform X2 [Copidosoma floridanum]|uniref:uncharacterized protein LOC106646921 isoform X2 n=1 Tax=Copidosoma floridanum TaxID=29053 RepID=UPI0006C9CA05|nr:uncharacterized protein LOC106646921 isoform X2 [Copidosoma floridanum]